MRSLEKPQKKCRSVEQFHSVARGENGATHPKPAHRPRAVRAAWIECFPKMGDGWIPGDVNRQADGWVGEGFRRQAGEPNPPMGAMRARMDHGSPPAPRSDAHVLRHGLVSY